MVAGPLHRPLPYWLIFQIEIVSNDFRWSWAPFWGAGRFGRQLNRATGFSFNQWGSAM